MTTTPEHATTTPHDRAMARLMVLARQSAGSGRDRVEYLAALRASVDRHGPGVLVAYCDGILAEAAEGRRGVEPAESIELDDTGTDALV